MQNLNDCRRKLTFPFEICPSEGRPSPRVELLHNIDPMFVDDFPCEYAADSSRLIKHISVNLLNTHFSPSVKYFLQGEKKKIE